MRLPGETTESVNPGDENRSGHILPGRHDRSGEQAMEMSLHRSLKERYATGSDGRSEVVIEGFRVDTIDNLGRLIEIQSGPLGPLRGKLGRLLPNHRIRIVKPVVMSRLVVRRSRRDGPDLSARRSPKRGELYDFFDDLVGVVRLFPHPNLDIEILGVTIDEVRVPRRRRPGYAVVDRRLDSIHESSLVASGPDLWKLLPSGCDGRRPFTTLDLCEQLDRDPWFAQRIAYCLRLTGAARVVGKAGNRLVYSRVA